jgi:hypothetical protein
MYHIYHLNDINILFLHYVHLLMKLSSYEFEIISFYYKGPFAYAKELLACAKNSQKIWT